MVKASAAMTSLQLSRYISGFKVRHIMAMLAPWRSYIHHLEGAPLIWLVMRFEEKKSPGRRPRKNAMIQRLAGGEERSELTPSIKEILAGASLRALLHQLTFKQKKRTISPQAKRPQDLVFSIVPDKHSLQIPVVGVQH